MKQIENDTPNTEISASPSLFIELQQLIISSKSKLASHVNSAISQLYWQIGKQINDELLKQKRADYGKQIVKSLSEKLTEEFGKGFNYSALTRMQKFYLSFSEYEIVATLSQQLSWSHFILLLAIKNQQAQDFYAHMSATEHWSIGACALYAVVLILCCLNALHFQINPKRW